MQAQMWLLTLKQYSIAVSLTYIATKAAYTEAVYQYIVLQIASSTSRKIDGLEVQGHALNSFPKFEKLFIN